MLSKLRTSLLIVLLVYTIGPLTPPVTAAPRLTVFPENWMAAPMAQLQILWVSNDFWYNPSPKYASGVIISPKMVLEAGHTIYSHGEGFIKNHNYMRANYGRMNWPRQHLPRSYPVRQPASGSFVRRSYRMANPGSLESFNSDFGISYVIGASSKPNIYNNWVRLKAADPNGSYPHSLFRERPNSWRIVRNAARSSSTKIIMCYPSGYYTSLRHADRYKLHWAQGPMQFDRADRSTTHDRNGLQNAWYYTNFVEVGQGCSGGALINHESGIENRKLLGTVISGSPSRLLGVRLADSKVLRLARSVSLLAHPGA